MAFHDIARPTCTFSINLVSRARLERSRGFLKGDQPVPSDADSTKSAIAWRSESVGRQDVLTR